LRTIAVRLTQMGEILAPQPFVWYAMATGAERRLQAGSYRIRPGDSGADLLQKLREGRVEQFAFTIVEGSRLRDVLQNLRDEPRLRFDTALQPADVMARLGADGAAEGQFFPDTYFFAAGDDGMGILRRAYRRMQERLAAAWRVHPASPELRSMEQALILASIIEKESGDPRDRRMISGVFHRRLARGMKLQSDPTVIYGLGAAFDGNLTREQLREPTPYNTYVHRGLPPTAICLPGFASIYAALWPAQGDSLYFVARGDGSSEFSESLDAHREAVRRYQSPAVEKGDDRR